MNFWEGRDYLADELDTFELNIQQYALVNI